MMPTSLLGPSEPSFRSASLGDARAPSMRLFMPTRSQQPTRSQRTLQSPLPRRRKTLANKLAPVVSFVGRPSFVPKWRGPLPGAQPRPNTHEVLVAVLLASKTAHFANALRIGRRRLVEKNAAQYICRAWRQNNPALRRRALEAKVAIEKLRPARFDAACRAVVRRRCADRLAAVLAFTANVKNFRAAVDRVASSARAMQRAARKSLQLHRAYRVLLERAWQRVVQTKNFTADLAVEAKSSPAGFGGVGWLSDVSFQLSRRRHALRDLDGRLRELEASRENVFISARLAPHAKPAFAAKHKRALLRRYLRSRLAAHAADVAECRASKGRCAHGLDDARHLVAVLLHGAPRPPTPACAADERFRLFAGGRDALEADLLVTARRGFSERRTLASVLARFTNRHTRRAFEAWALTHALKTRRKSFAGDEDAYTWDPKPLPPLVRSPHVRFARRVRPALNRALDRVPDRVRRASDDGTAGERSSGLRSDASSGSFQTSGSFSPRAAPRAFGEQRRRQTHPKERRDSTPSLPCLS